jgi:predicted kinase
MPEVNQVRQPVLIVVAGPPGAGKTTLAYALARAVRYPAVSRDEIKEGLVCTTGEVGEPGGDLQRHATDAFFDTLALLLGRGVSVVAEAAFQHKVWAPRLEPLRAVARVRVVLCEISLEQAVSRRLARGSSDPARLRFHPEEPGREGATGRYDPPRLGVPTLRVDTSDGYQPAFETIVEFARARDAPRGGGQTGACC